MDRRKDLFDVKTLTAMGMLTALAYAVAAVCKVIPKVGGFLSLDMIDAVIGVGGFLFGPLSVALMSVAEALLEFVSVSTTGWYGLLMNIISTTLFLVPAVCIYRRSRRTAGAAGGLAVGVVCRTAGMIVWNYIVTPAYFGMPRAAVLGLMPTIILFNLVKGVLNAALIMILYPPVSTALRRVGLAAPGKAQAQGEAHRFNYAPLLVSVLVLITAALAVWAMLGD